MRHIIRSIAAKAAKPPENGSFYTDLTTPNRQDLRPKIYGIDRYTLHGIPSSKNGGSLRVSKWALVRTACVRSRESIKYVIISIACGEHKGIAYCMLSGPRNGCGNGLEMEA